MLRVIFDTLDEENKKSLSHSQLLNVFSNGATKDMLRYTLFYAAYKTKQSRVFGQLLANYEDGVSEGNVRSRITFEMLAAELESIVRESRVQPKHMRLHEEHVRICTLGKPALGEAVSGLQRRAYFRRVLRSGDLVWALYGGGCTWFPAVVEDVRQDGAYRLKYLFTAGAIKKKARASMRYLRQPNAMDIQKKLTPADETQICAFVFDQLNTAGSGRMDGQELLISLQSTACAGLVKASVVISHGDASAR